MLQHCYYYDKITGLSRRITIQEMLRRAAKNDVVFRSMKNSLYRTDNQKVQMVLVKKGAHKGFRRKGFAAEIKDFHSRGERESFTHQGNKDVFLVMKEFDIVFNNQRVRLYIDTAELEKTVWCNNSRYEIDVYYKLSGTDPAEYFERWNGELYVELFHTCEVEYIQAEDFAIEGKALFEYRIPEDSLFYDNISEAGYDIRVNFLARRNKRNGIEGFLVSGNEKEKYSWHRSKQGNMTFKSNGEYFTVLKNKYESGYVVCVGKRNIISTLNLKEFLTEQDAMKAAEYFAFYTFNGHELKPDPFIYYVNDFHEVFVFGNE